MIVEECDRGCGGFVNLGQILGARVVGRHLLEQQIGITEDDRKVILQLVLELGFVSHRMTFPWRDDANRAIARECCGC
jgi:hypothetical protein